jgi:hypothetical protein
MQIRNVASLERVNAFAPCVALLVQAVSVGKSSSVNECCVTGGVHVQELEQIPPVGPGFAFSVVGA